MDKYPKLPLACQVCGKEFANSMDYLAHRQILPIEGYICPAPLQLRRLGWKKVKGVWHGPEESEGSTRAGDASHGVPPAQRVV